MSRRTYYILFYAILFCLRAQVWAVQAGNDASRHMQPEEIVKLIFVDRIEHYDWERMWDLDSIKEYFSNNLQRDINDYTSESRRFFAKYAKYSSHMIQLGLYLDLTQGDPITAVHDSPKSAKINLMKKDKVSREYKVTYRMYGTSKGAPQFNQNVHVSLDLVGSKWVIEERWFDVPMGSFDPTVRLWTLDELLKRLTQELRDCTTWAVRHPNDLTPNNAEVHVGRGPFDKP